MRYILVYENRKDEESKMETMVLDWLDYKSFTAFFKWTVICI